MRFRRLTAQEIAVLNADQRRLGFASDHALNGWAVTPHTLVAFVDRNNGKVLATGVLIRVIGNVADYEPVRPYGPVPQQRVRHDPESIDLSRVLMVTLEDLDAHHERMQNNALAM